MSDQLKWLRLQCDAPFDPGIMALPPAIRWAWVATLCYVQVHGTIGSLTLPDTDAGLAGLMAATGIKTRAALETCYVTVPNMRYIRSNGNVTVTFCKWKQYHGDTTNSSRQKRYREKRRSDRSSNSTAPDGSVSTKIVVDPILPPGAVKGRISPYPVNVLWRYPQVHGHDCMCDWCIEYHPGPRPMYEPPPTRTGA